MEPIAGFFTPRAAWLFDPQIIYNEWAALQGAYDVNRWALPLPIWAQRGYDHSGASAWEILQQDLWGGAVDRPMCIYLHIPFCSSKCGFCDSYSFSLRAADARQKETYVDLLCSELDLWSHTGMVARRPVSTVHLGGGTPTFLGERLFSRLVYHCMDNFNVTPQTEWALESNVSTLTPFMINTLSELGFRRIHVGVQSLEDPVRKAIGRRQPADRVIAAIASLVAGGWIVSVDLICGLPGQTLAGVVDGIQALVDIGVNGFSLYELLIYPQNRKWAERHGLGRAITWPISVCFKLARGSSKRVVSARTCSTIGRIRQTATSTSPFPARRGPARRGLHRRRRVRATTSTATSATRITPSKAVRAFPGCSAVCGAARVKKRLSRW